MLSLKMLTQRKQALLEERTRTSISPKRMDIMKIHLGKPESNELGKKRQYLAPNSAFLAKGATINFLSPEKAKTYLVNTDNTIENLIRADPDFDRSLDNFLYESSVYHPVKDTDVVALTALSPEVTKLCRVSYHATVNNKLGVDINSIPNEDQEFDFIVDSIIANPYNLGPVLERGHNDTNLGTHIFKPEITEIYSDMHYDIIDMARDKSKRKFDKNEDDLERVITRVIKSGNVPSKSVSRTIRSLLDDLNHNKTIIRPINYSRRADALTDITYKELNSELDLKIPLRGTTPVKTNSGNNHGVISTYNNISRQFTNPL